MDWRDHIPSDPKVLSAGKPVVKGSRLPVDFLLDLLANGWSEEQLLDSYPNLTHESPKAVCAFAAESTATNAPSSRAAEARCPGAHASSGQRARRVPARSSIRLSSFRSGRA